MNFRFDKDWCLLKKLKEDKNIQFALRKIDTEFSGYGYSSSRRLLSGALKLNSRFYPQITSILEECKKILGFDEKIKIFSIPSPFYNAFCFKDPSGYTIGLHSGLIEAFSEQELAFVIGHEIGHLMFDHTELPMPLIATIRDRSGNIVPLKIALELFIWSRSAEVSADRAGLLACGSLNAAINSLFKLTSGLNADVKLENIESYLLQIDALNFNPSSRKEFEREDPSIDCFQTHPASPIRIRALINAARSDIFKKYRSQLPLSSLDMGTILSLQELDQLVFKDLEIMEPTYLEGSDENSKILKELFLYASTVVANADGKFKKSESEAQKALLGSSLVEQIENQSSENIKKRLNSLIDEVNGLNESSQIPKLIIHLIVISTADGILHEEEILQIEKIACKLKIEPSFVTQAIQSFYNSMD